MDDNYIYFITKDTAETIRKFLDIAFLPKNIIEVPNNIFPESVQGIKVDKNLTEKPYKIMREENKNG